MTRMMLVISKVHDVAVTLGELADVPAAVRRQVLEQLYRAADSLTGGVQPYEESQALEVVAELRMWKSACGLPPAEELIDELHELAVRLSTMGLDQAHSTSRTEAQTAIAGLSIAAEALLPSVTEGESQAVTHAIEDMGKLALGEAL